MKLYKQVYGFMKYALKSGTDQQLFHYPVYPSDINLL
jgi:hypothetical protein